MKTHALKLFIVASEKLVLPAPHSKHYYRKPNRSKNFEFEIYRREIKFLMAV